MPSNYDKIDLRFSWNGDYSIGPDGDVADTSQDQIVAVVEQVQTILSSSARDWEEYPSLGVGLDDFVGEPNTKEVARRLELKVKDVLIISNTVRANDLDVKVIPVGIHSVLIIVKIQALATSSNSLQSGTSGIVVSVVFDYQEHGIFVLDKTVA